MTKVSPTMRGSNHPRHGASGNTSSFFISSRSTAACFSPVSVIKSIKIMINMSGILVWCIKILHCIEAQATCGANVEFNTTGALATI